MKRYIHRVWGREEPKLEDIPYGMWAERKTSDNNIIDGVWFIFTTKTKETPKLAESQTKAGI